MTIKNKLLFSVMLVILGSCAFAMNSEANMLYQQACSAEYKEDYTTAVEKLLQALSVSQNDVMIYTKLAGVYNEMGEYDKALEVYNKVAELKPTDGYIYISVGNIYETQGKYKEALEAYGKVQEMCPEYLYNYLNIANVQYQMKDYKTAIENYNKFLSTYAQHREARENLAASYLSDANYKAAVNEYETLYTKNPVAFKSFSKYGFALFEEKKYDKAVEILEKAVEANPENTSAHVHLALSYQELGKNDLALAQYDVVFRQQPALNSIRFEYGNLLAEMGQEEAAIENYKIYISSYPDDYRGYQNIGIAYKSLNNIDETIANYEKALKLQKDKKDIELQKDLAQCYHLKKDYKNALKYYDEALLVQKDNYDLRYNRALVLHATEKYSDAIEIYSELLQERNNTGVQNNLNAALVSLGNEYLKAHNYSLATETFVRAIDGGSKDSFAYYGLAKSYRACGINDKAGEYYEKAISMSPEKTEYSKEYAEFISATMKVPDTLDVSGDLQEIKLSDEPEKVVDETAKYKDLVSKGDENYKNKNYELSVSSYRDALKINPSDEVTLLKLGNIYRLKEDNKNAINFYKKSIVINPNYSDGWFNLGLVYASEKNNNKAKECFHRVIALNPNYSYAYYALGLAYEQDGNNKEALNNYKIFLTQNKDEATAKIVKQKIEVLEK